MYLPQILKAKVNRKIIIDNYIGILLEDISVIGLFDIQYHYLFVLYNYEVGTSPLICFSSEWGSDTPKTKNIPFLCAFTNDGHVNFGEDYNWIDIELFLNESLKKIKKQFKISKQIKINTVLPTSINRDTIRTKEQIINQFKVSEKYFESIYSSYEEVFTNIKSDLYVQNENVGLWNDDHEYFNDSNNFSEEEISLAKYNIYQAILNRVVVRFITDGKHEYKKKWWKFWK